MRAILIAFFSLLIFQSHAQKFYKSGELPIYNFQPSEYVKQHPQNHDVKIAKNRLLYLCNNGGLLFYNGIKWARVNNFKKKALIISEDDSGELFIGGENDFGTIKIDSIGNQFFVSYLNNLPDSIENLGRIINVLNSKVTTYFIFEKVLFEFENDSLVSIYRTEKSLSSFIYDNKLHLIVNPEGIIVLKDSIFIPINNSPAFTSDFEPVIKSDTIYLINRGSVQQLIIDSNEAKIIEDMYFEFNFRNDKITDALIHNNYYFISTEDEGLLIFDSKLQLIKHIHSSNSNLQMNFIRGMELDDNGNLYLALDRGASVIDLNSPISSYGRNQNITGTINDLDIINNDLFIGGTQGLLRADIFYDSIFHPAANVIGECWSVENVILNNTQNILFATDNTIELLSNGKADTLSRAFPWDIHQPKYNSNRIWIGDDRGFILFKYGIKGFEKEYENFKINAQIRKISTDIKGDIWLGSRNKGIYYLNTKELNSDTIPEPKFFDSTFGLPSKSPYVFPFLIGNLTLMATTEGIYEFDVFANGFKKSTRFTSKDSIQNRIVLNVFDLGGGKIWITNRNEDQNNFENGIYDLKKNTWTWKNFKDLSKGVQFGGTYDSTHKELWVGGSEGLFRIKNLEPEPLKFYQAFISQIKYDPDSLMFGGHMFDGFVNNTYSYSRKPLRFSFGANSYKRKDDLKFKYFLEGFDETWTDWNEEAEAVYTNLPGGSYIMRVKAIDFFENESEEASFAFTILPPWYLTSWAYTLYFFGFIGFVYAAIRVSTISLQRVIKENTREIVAQKDEIEAKNTVLESQKGRIEKQNLNILDSIRYAKRIQMATLPAEDKIQKSVENAWVMYRPKDIVSGDFYWLENYKDDNTEKTLIAAVDCTGHGVPGAFMSIIGYNGLNRVVREYRLNKPSEVLDRLNEIITTTLNQQGAQREEIKDGMDMSLCSLDRKNLKLEYAGAHNSLYIIRKKDKKLNVNGNEIDEIMSEKGHNLFEIKADKQPIGAFENRKNFTNHIIQLEKSDMVILFTDGYADQFGGPKGKKFFYKPFKRLLLSIADEHVNRQHEIIEQTFNEWISYPDSNGDVHEQIDDICVLGVRV